MQCLFLIFNSEQHELFSQGRNERIVRNNLCHKYKNPKTKQSKINCLSCKTCKCFQTRSGVSRPLVARKLGKKPRVCPSGEASEVKLWKKAGRSSFVRTVSKKKKKTRTHCASHEWVPRFDDRFVTFAMIPFAPSSSKQRSLLLNNIILFILL